METNKVIVTVEITVSSNDDLISHQDIRVCSLDMAKRFMQDLKYTGEVCEEFRFSNPGDPPMEIVKVKGVTTCNYVIKECYEVMLPLTEIQLMIKELKTSTKSNSRKSTKRKQAHKKDKVTIQKMRVRMEEVNDDVELDDLELLLRQINEFCTSSNIPEDVPIPPELESYLAYVAKCGNSVFPWQHVRLLFRLKMFRAISQFGGEPCGKEEAVSERFDLFRAAPFTIQRFAELITQPTRHYKKKEKFLHGLEKTVLVVSTVDPQIPGSETHANGNDFSFPEEQQMEQDCQATTQTITQPIRPFIIDASEIVTTKPQVTSSASSPSRETSEVEPPPSEQISTTITSIECPVTEIVSSSASPPSKETSEVELPPSEQISTTASIECPVTEIVSSPASSLSKETSEVEPPPSEQISTTASIECPVTEIVSSLASPPSRETSEVEPPPSEQINTTTSIECPVTEIVSSSCEITESIQTETTSIIPEPTTSVNIEPSVVEEAQVTPQVPNDDS